MKRKAFLAGMGGLILNSCGQPELSGNKKPASNGVAPAGDGNGVNIQGSEPNEPIEVPGNTSTRKVDKDLAEFTIALNVGHCSNGDGASFGGIVERKCNELQTAVAQKVLIDNGIPKENIKILEYNGCPGDPLKQIAKHAKDFTVFVSVHNNAGKGGGPETFAHRQAGPNDTALNNLLFQNIYDRVKPQGQTQYRGPKNVSWDVLVGARNYNVLAASLTEGFFVDDPKLNGSKAKGDALCDYVGAGIGHGILAHLRKKKSGQVLFNSENYITNIISDEEIEKFILLNGGDH